MKSIWWKIEYLKFLKVEISEIALGDPESRAKAKIYGLSSGKGLPAVTSKFLLLNSRPGILKIYVSNFDFKNFQIWSPESVKLKFLEVKEFRLLK